MSTLKLAGYLFLTLLLSSLREVVALILVEKSEVVYIVQPQPELPHARLELPPN